LKPSFYSKPKFNLKKLKIVTIMQWDKMVYANYHLH